MYNVLIFPAWTEIWLEINKALKFSKEVNLFWANLDVPNHAPFVYETYFTISSIKKWKEWINELNKIIIENKIDYLIPAYDDVVLELSKIKNHIKCKVLVPEFEVADITRSKIKTYHTFRWTDLLVPKTYETNRLEDITKYPIFVKPDIWQWSQWAIIVYDRQELENIIKWYWGNIVISENLTWDEYTVDCFSSKWKWILYVWWRQRIRCKNWISLTSKTITKPEFSLYAQIIFEKLWLVWAWFFQVKYDENWILKLLEIAPRISWTMATNRVKWINFPLLSIYENENISTDIITNNYDVVIDRALENKYKIDIDYKYVYIDLDDTIIVKKKINYNIIWFLYRSLNEWKKILLITKNTSWDLVNLLKKYRISELFDEVIHLNKDDEKFKYLRDKDSIFIDDSFNERSKVKNMLNIPVFDLDMIECLF